jgi:dihydroorotase-like cyclic amidohydrolase
VVSDHAVFNSTQKAVGKPPKGDFRVLPNGVNGIEERMHMVWHTMVNSGKMSPSQVCAACTLSLHPNPDPSLSGQLCCRAQ